MTVPATLQLLRREGLAVVAAWGPDRAVRRESALRAAVARVAEERRDAPLVFGAERCPDCGREHGRPLARIARERTAPEPAGLSLSHAVGLTVAAASTRGHVGVDAVDTSRTDHQDPRAWARIEAVLKADGRGLRVEPSRIRFDPDGSAAELNGTTYRLTDLTLDSVVIALAVTAAPEAAS